MILVFYYPLSEKRVIIYEPNVTDIEYRSKRGENWHKAEIVSDDTSNYSRASKRLLIQELKRCIKYRVPISKDTTIEELLCKINI